MPTTITRYRAITLFPLGLVYSRRIETPEQLQNRNIDSTAAITKLYFQRYEKYQYTFVFFDACINIVERQCSEMFPQHAFNK